MAIFNSKLLVITRGYIFFLAESPSADHSNHLLRVQVNLLMKRAEVKHRGDLEPTSPSPTHSDPARANI